MLPNPACVEYGHVYDPTEHGFVPGGDVIDFYCARCQVLTHRQTVADLSERELEEIGITLDQSDDLNDKKEDVT